MTVLPDTKTVEAILIAVLRDDARCVRDGDALTLDTPFTLQDGHLLRVYLEPSGDGGYIVTDGGFAAGQVESFARNSAILRERRAELKRIASALELEWRDEFRFIAEDLESAMRGVSVLSIAVNRALSLVHARPVRPTQPLRARLGDAFREAGLKVKQRAKIIAQRSELAVTVDFRLQSQSHEAAIEVLTSRTEGGAQSVVDKAAANFNVLARGGYSGLLVAVYDEASPAGRGSVRERFLQAGPDNMMVLPGARAEHEIISRLAA